MSRRCELTGTCAQYGNNVSHSNRKTRRRFQPNIQQVSLRSDALDRTVPLKITTATLRSIDHSGGLDAFLLNTIAAKLAPKGVALRREVKKAQMTA